MRVKFTREHRAGDRTFAAGSEYDLPDREARAFLAAGQAEEVTEGDEPRTMRLRFRHDWTLAGKTHLAGSMDRVPVNDEAWDAVNLGHADLDPPPGVAGQPFPPEDVRRDETTEAPLPAPPITAVPSGTARLTGATPPPPKRGTAPAKATGGKTPDVAPVEASRLEEGSHETHTHSAPTHMPSAPQSTPPVPPGGPKRGGR